MENTEWLFANEKTNAVLVVLLIIWIAVILHLLYINRKVSRIEKQMNAD